MHLTILLGQHTDMHSDKNDSISRSLSPLSPLGFDPKHSNPDQKPNPICRRLLQDLGLRPGIGEAPEMPASNHSVQLIEATLSFFGSLVVLREGTVSIFCEGSCKGTLAQVAGFLPSPTAPTCRWNCLSALEVPYLVQMTRH